MTAKEPLPKRKCAGCGKSFTPTTKRQRFHTPKCRDTTKRAAKVKADAEPTPEAKVVQWATVHGAPVRLLEGWDPDTGEWSDGSPIGQVLHDVARGTHLAVTGKRHGFANMNELLLRGAEYGGMSEDRAHIPIEVLPLVDLFTLVNYHESGAEIEMSNSVYDEALKNGKLGLDFLGRRWPSRWREQSSILAIDEDDLREAAVTALITDPATAMQLAAMAETVETSVEETERAKA